MGAKVLGVITAILFWGFIYWLVTVKNPANLLVGNLDGWYLASGIIGLILSSVGIGFCAYKSIKWLVKGKK